MTGSHRTKSAVGDGYVIKTSSGSFLHKRSSDDTEHKDGNPNLEKAAEQIASILYLAHQKNCVGSGLQGWSQESNPTFMVSDEGAIHVIGEFDDQKKYDVGMGIVMGQLSGIGMGINLPNKVDRYGLSEAYAPMSPVYAAIRFETFGDLAKAANAMSKAMQLGPDHVVDMNGLSSTRPTANTGRLMQLAASIGLAKQTRT
jgi:hypothetical protein